MRFLKDLYSFLKSRRKLWLLPVILVMVAFGLLLLVAQSTVFAPFIYSVF